MADSRAPALLDQLIALLQEDKRFVVEGRLNKNMIVEHALKLDKALIKLLLSKERIKEHFFTDIDGTLVFDKDKFIAFVDNKQFLPDSYTAFKNKIGLTLDGKDDYLKERKDVVLVWPYKDCVLEGGQTKEDHKRDEIFWNETLVPDEIDRLFEPKVLTNFKRFDKDGEHKVSEVKDADNLIIKGNNLLALHTLKEKFAGKVKLIYIDPPYNPDSNSNTFCYNNTFNESTWLTFIKNRLEAAKTLLRNDGVLIVAIDDNEQAPLWMLLRELFKEYEIHCITIVHNPRGVQGTNFSYTHEYAFFVVPKGRRSIGDRNINEDEIDFSNLRNWGGESLRTDGKNCFYPVIVEDNKIAGFGDVLEENIHPAGQTVEEGSRCLVYPIDGSGVERKWRYARQSVEDVEHLLRAKKTKRGYEIEIGKDFGTYRTVWQDPRYDANEYGTKIVKALVPDCKFDFPKSLYNVYDCIYAAVAQDKDAIVLDFFAGSGTTAHAVLELNKEDKGNRRYILCEQMHYVETVTVKRLQKVIANNGQGDFVYCELLKWNEQYVERIEEAKSTKDLADIWRTMQDKAHLSYKVDLEAFDRNAKEFAQLSFEDQRKLLLEVLDKNQLYVNYCEIEDADYKVSEEDEKLNKLFYRG
jgi:adenine-specific DNA-methyltransferase